MCRQLSNSMESFMMNVITNKRSSNSRRIPFLTILFVTALMILIQTVKVTLDYSSQRTLNLKGGKEKKMKIVNIGEEVEQPFTTTTTTTTNDTTTITSSSKTTPSSREDLMCKWSPGNDEECVNHLVDRITTQAINQNKQRLVFKRWVLTGDSTMWRLFMYSPILKRLSRRPCWTWGCQWKGQTQGGKCDEFANIIGVEKPITGWKPPNHFQQQQLEEHDKSSSTSWKTLLFGRKEETNNPAETAKIFGHHDDLVAEGPHSNGLYNPYCTDCHGCSAFIVFCQRKDDYPPPPCNITHSDYSIGAYFPIEFARDVEIQSTLYPTTQENFAHYLNEEWNIPYMVRTMGRPVCLIQTGIHDVGIPNITIQQYLRNVEFYAQLMINQCSHIIWLGNTSPKTEYYAQKYNQTRDWNMAVLDLLLRLDDNNSSNKFSFIDVFEASRNATYADNVHMGDGWYNNLGGIFSQVIAKLAAI